jgi:hypothetical protein
MKCDGNVQLTDSRGLDSSKSQKTMHSSSYMNASSHSQMAFSIGLK